MLRLYWQPVWMRDEDRARKIGDATSHGTMLMAQEHFQKIVNDAHAAGVADGAAASERKGAIRMGEEVRKLIAEYPLSEYQKEHHGMHMTPVWALERLLEDWNVPDMPALNTNQDREER